MRSQRPERWLLPLFALAAAAGGAWGREPGGGGLARSLSGKEPITITADRLEYDYRRNVVVYRGGVEVTQGPTRLRSDTITITLAQGSGPGGRGAPPGAGGAEPAAATRVQEIVASGSVRIDQGARWATGGRAVFDQDRRTIVLLEDPVLHDGPNEVQGERVVVYLDEERSVVEGGRKRVKAVLYPDTAPEGSAGPGSGQRGP